MKFYLGIFLETGKWKKEEGVTVLISETAIWTTGLLSIGMMEADIWRFGGL